MFEVIKVCFFKSTLLLLALASFGCSTSPEREKAKKQANLYLKLGSVQLSKGHYPQALKNLILAEQLAPEDAKIQNNLGLAYYVRGKLEPSEKHLKKAVQITPEYTEARNNLGRVLIESGKPKEAIEQLTIAVKDLTYEFPEKSHSNLGYAYFELQDFTNALIHLRKSLHLRKDSCSTYTYYGRTLYSVKKYKLAVQAFNNALPLCANDPNPAKYYAALSYVKLEKLEKASTYFEEIIKLTPTSPFAEKSRIMLTHLKKAN